MSTVNVKKFDVGKLTKITNENVRFFEIFIYGLIEGLENWYYDKW